MNEHYDRIAAIADDLIYGLLSDRDRKLSEYPGAVYVPDEDRRRKALRLVEECAEYFCPPPQQLIQALRLAFMGSEREPVSGKKRKSIGAKTIDEEATIRLLAGGARIEPGSWRAFCKAATAEAQECEVGADGAVTYRMPVMRIANAAGVDRKSIRQWRGNLTYQREVRAASKTMGK